MAATKKAGLVVKKKRWITVLPPKYFGDQPIGEIFAAEPQDAIGRKMLVSLSTLTGDPQKQALNVKFQISSVDGDVLRTDVLGIEWLPAAVRKLVRRGREKMDESFIVVTGDGKKIRIKILMLGKNKTTRGVTAKLRKAARQFVTRASIKQKYEELVMDVVHHKLQHGIQDALKKIYPLAVCEVRQMYILGPASQEEIDAAKAALPPEKPEKKETKEVPEPVEQAPAAEPVAE